MRRGVLGRGDGLGGIEGGLWGEGVGGRRCFGVSGRC